MSDMNPKNIKRSFEVTQYSSGTWEGKWVVRETITQDIAATITKEEADHLVRRLEKDTQP